MFNNVLLLIRHVVCVVTTEVRGRWYRYKREGNGEGGRQGKPAEKA
jgi:hypothetical protein